MTPVPSDFTIAPPAPGLAGGWKTMSRILIPLDGSAASRAVLSVLPTRLACYRTPVTLDLVHVCAPLDEAVARCLSAEQQAAHHREEGLALLAPLAAELEAQGDAGLRPSLNLHVPVSSLVADAIVGLARTLQVDEILMSTHGHGVEDKQFLGSVSSEVVRLASVPVALVGPGASS
jgi:nucleotide-binding universal stress UspA family protein